MADCEACVELTRKFGAEEGRCAERHGPNTISLSFTVLDTNEDALRAYIGEGMNE